MEALLERKMKYQDVLVNLDNTISVKQSEIEKLEADIAKLRVEIKSSVEDRERVIGALGVISEIEEAEKLALEQNKETNQKQG